MAFFVSNFCNRTLDSLHVHAQQSLDVQKPSQVKAFVELAGSLLSAGAPKPVGSPQRAQTQGLSGEMLRSMRFAGVISALIGAMELLDSDHPQVCFLRMPPCNQGPSQCMPSALFVLFHLPAYTL